MWSDPGDLTDAARGEPEHVLHQAVTIGVESYKLLLDKLLTALGAQTRGHTTQAAAVVRSEIGDKPRECQYNHAQHTTYMHTSDLTSCWN